MFIGSVCLLCWVCVCHIGLVPEINFDWLIDDWSIIQLTNNELYHISHSRQNAVVCNTRCGVCSAVLQGGIPKPRRRVTEVVRLYRGIRHTAMASLTLSQTQSTLVDVCAEGRCRQKSSTRDRRPEAVPMSTIVDTFESTKNQNPNPSSWATGKIFFGRERDNLYRDIIKMFDWKSADTPQQKTSNKGKS